MLVRGQCSVRDTAQVPSPLRRVHQRMKRLSELDDDDDDDDAFTFEHGGALGSSGGAVHGRCWRLRP